MLVLLFEIGEFKLVLFCLGFFIGFFEFDDNYFVEGLLIGENKLVEVELLFEFKRNILSF